MPSKPYDRRFMELAIKWMHKSRYEHHDKPDPVVGAVLVSKNGKVLAKTGRAVLREGNHAEYQIIERTLKDKDLEGTTLYVTLEPCAKRNAPKKPCAEWIYKARVGRVVIGICDPDPSVNGQGIALLNSKNVELDFFDPALQKVIRKENKAFIEDCERRKSPSAPTPDYQGVSDEDSKQVTGSSVADLSLDVIREYTKRLGLPLKVPSPRLWEYMKKAGFLVEASKKAVPIPTVAGLVCFGKSPDHILHQCKIKAYRLKGKPEDRGNIESRVIGNGQ